MSGRHTGSLGKLVQGSASGAVVALGLSVPIPAKENWKIWGVTVLITTTATVGDRLVTVELLGVDDVLLATFVAGAVVTASLTGSINFGALSEAAVAGGTPLISLMVGMPAFVALAGQRLRITDQTGVDVADTAKVLVSAEWEPT